MVFQRFYNEELLYGHDLVRTDTKHQIKLLFFLSAKLKLNFSFFRAAL